MKIIDKSNFFSSVCVSYTIFSLLKILIEYLVMGKFGTDQGNYVLMFGICFMSVFVLSQHYRFQKLPLSAVIIGQYVVLLSGILLFTWISGFFEKLHPDSYFDMFRSFTIFYLLGAGAYYAELYAEIKRANSILKKLQKKKEGIGV